MIEVPVCDASGKQVETLKLEESQLGGMVKARLLQQAVVGYQANQHQGTASAKTRAEVRGSRRKLYRQKGTGFARRGSRQSPILRGGGTWGGPHPRDYRKKLPRKARRQALNSALLGKLKDNEVFVVEDLDIDEPRTKKAAQVLNALGVTTSCLVVILEYNEVMLRAMRNLPGIELRVMTDLNAYDVVRFKRLLFTKQAYEKLLGEARAQA